MYNHNNAQQSKNRVHISWDILYFISSRVLTTDGMRAKLITTCHQTKPLKSNSCTVAIMWRVAELKIAKYFLTDMQCWGDLSLNKLGPGRYRRRFVNYILKSIYRDETLCILIKALLMFVPQGSVVIESPLIHIIACHWTDYKPLP